MDRTHIRYIFTYTFSYMAIGSMMPLIGRYLAQEGFSGAQIGTVTAAGTLVAIFASAFWGSIFDRSKNSKRVVMMLCICAAAVALGLSLIHIYGVFLAVYGVMYFFQAPVMGLVDAMCLEDGKALGSARMWGAVGYALGVFVSGRIAGAAGLGVIFFMYAASYVLSAVFIASMRKGQVRLIEQCETELAEIASNENTGFRQLLQNKTYLKLIAAIFFVGGTNVANNTYFTFLYSDCGGSMAGMAAAMLLMVGSEAPFMAWSEKLSAHFTLEKMILAGMIISVIRYSWYATCPPAVAITALFFLQGMVNGIILVEAIRYIGKVVPAALTGLAVSGYYAISSNASTIVCQLIGGFVLDRWGGGGVYMFFALYNIAGVMIYIGFGLHKQAKQRL